MTEKKRIFWNTVATYGRSLYALIVGVFTARWVLMTLGEVDYGLFGALGGIVGFIAFVNGLLSQAVSRFYAYSVGEAASSHDERGLEESRRWFNVAVSLHTVIPLTLMLVGYPIGEWAVRHYMTIPPDRIEVCVWVFRMSCINCLVGMCSVPYYALYTAHQEIAELTIYGFVGTTLNVFFLSYMVSHAGDWFLAYSVWMCLLANVPMLIIIARAFKKYQEARFVPKYLWDFNRVKKILEFAGGRLLVSIAFLLNENGVVVLVNKVLGPARNAAMTIGNTISGHTMTLTGALQGALQPAITNAAGEGDFEKMRSLAFAACKFTTLSLLIFAIPLALEIENVLVIWLKNPPALIGPLTICLLGVSLCDQISCGHWISIFAIGKVTRFSAVESVVWFTVLPMCILAVWLGFDVVGVGFAFLASKFLAIGIKLYFGQTISGLSIRYWMNKVLAPVVITSVLTICAGLPVVLCLPATFLRVVLTTMVCEIVFLPASFLICLNTTERQLVLKKLRLVK